MAWVCPLGDCCCCEEDEELAGGRRTKPCASAQEDERTERLSSWLVGIDGGQAGRVLSGMVGQQSGDVLRAGKGKLRLVIVAKRYTCPLGYAGAGL